MMLGYMGQAAVIFDKGHWERPSNKGLQFVGRMINNQAECEETMRVPKRAQALGCGKVLLDFS